MNEPHVSIDPRMRLIDRGIEIGAIPVDEIAGGHSIELKEIDGVWQKPKE